MEVTPWLIYLIGIADNLREMSSLAILGLFCLSIPMAYLSIEGEKVVTWALKCIVFPSFVMSVLLIAFVPSSKTLAAMYVIPAVVNNEQIQNIGKNGLESLELLTKQWVDELREEKSKKDD